MDIDSIYDGYFKLVKRLLKLSFKLLLIVSVVVGIPLPLYIRL